MRLVGAHHASTPFELYVGRPAFFSGTGKEAMGPIGLLRSGMAIQWVEHDRVEFDFLRFFARGTIEDRDFPTCFVQQM